MNQPPDSAARFESDRNQPSSYLAMANVIESVMSRVRHVKQML
jgi:hypothetical protein